MILKYSHYFTLLFFAFLTSCEKEGLVSPVYKDYTKDFDSVWTCYDLKYPLFDYKKIDWGDSYEQYKTKFNNISIDERNNLLVELLSIFKDPHINLTTSSGKIIGSFVPANFTINYNATYLNKFTNSFNWHIENNTWGWGITNNIGYIKITSFKPSDLDTMVFEKVLDSLTTTNGLVIDIRQNFGGSIYVINNIWNRFTNETKIVGYELYRNGPSHNEYAPEIPVISCPQGTFQYLKGVVLLIGQECASAGEIFAEAMSLNGSVTLVGDTTLGAVEAPLDYSLPDGTKFSVPIVAYLDNEHKPLEWSGVSPDIYIDPLKVKNNSAEDIVIEKAFDVINSVKHITSRSSRQGNRLHSKFLIRQTGALQRSLLPSHYVASGRIN